MSCITLLGLQAIHDWPQFQLSEEQLGQMYELKRATKDLWKPKPVGE